MKKNFTPSHGKKLFFPGFSGPVAGISLPISREGGGVGVKGPGPGPATPPWWVHSPPPTKGLPTACPVPPPPPRPTNSNCQSCPDRILPTPTAAAAVFGNHRLLPNCFPNHWPACHSPSPPPGTKTPNRGGGGIPSPDPPPPPSRPKRPSWETRILPAGKSGWAVFGTRILGPRAPPRLF